MSSASTNKPAWVISLGLEYVQVTEGKNRLRACVITALTNSRLLRKSTSISSGVDVIHAIFSMKYG